MKISLVSILFFAVATSFGMGQPSKLRIMRRHTQSSRVVRVSAPKQDPKSAHEIREGKFGFYRDALHAAFGRLKEEVDPQEQVVYFEEFCGLYEFAIALYPEVEAVRWLSDPSEEQKDMLRDFIQRLLNGCLAKK